MVNLHGLSVDVQSQRGLHLGSGGLPGRVVRHMLVLVAVWHLRLGRVAVIELVGVIFVDQVLLLVIVVIKVDLFLGRILDAVLFKVGLFIRAELVLGLLLLAMIRH